MFDVESLSLMLDGFSPVYIKFDKMLFYTLQIVLKAVSWLYSTDSSSLLWAQDVKDVKFFFLSKIYSHISRVAFLIHTSSKPRPLNTGNDLLKRLSGERRGHGGAVGRSQVWLQIPHISANQHQIHYVWSQTTALQDCSTIIYFYYLFIDSN